VSTILGRQTGLGEQQTSRREFLTLATVAGTAVALGGLPTFSAAAAEPSRPRTSPLAPEDSALMLWYPAPAADDAMIREGLPVGNGRLGALVGGAPARERLLVTDGTMWTGGRNDVLEGDGQFPYSSTDFGTFTLLAELTVDLPAHTTASVSGYRRTLDLANGLVTASYVHDGVTFRREVFASHPDDVVVIRMTQSGGGTYTGTIALTGTHGETTSADPAGKTASFGAAFANGLKYGAAVTAAGGAGTITATGTGISFDGCTELTVVLSGGTNYAPDLAAGYRNPGLDPVRLATSKAGAAARVASATLMHTHVADYRALFDRMALTLGASSAAQRALDTWQRLQARAADGSAPDPELEAAYLQFGRYLMICGSRDSVPLNLQGLWLDGNFPDWMGDYHTDINLQMNYWMADRAGLSPCFDALTDYLLAQLPSWTELTNTHFNDPRNRFRNTSGRIAGWTVAFSSNIYGGLGWWWHPGGSAWLANSLWEHYEYTQDERYLERIYPLLKGACEFWQSRLISTLTVTPGVTKSNHKVLIDDHDWSPEHGPQDARGMTYAQEVVWTLFANYRTACSVLRRDSRFSLVVRDLQEQLYLPEVSPTSGWLEEWMSPDNLGETTHRHLSPLINLFPGDRIRRGAVADSIVDGATKLLTARGMDSFGWANAWRSACWARLGDGEKAYQLLARNLKPSIDHSNGSAMNLFDMYQVDPSRTIFQIDANFGTPAAMVEMLLYSRPGHVELLPALPAAWAAAGSITGVGVRGGFVIDLEWRNGRPRQAKVTSVGGRSTTVTGGGVSHRVSLKPGQSVVLRGFGG
jgi:alpha-L-fucosidase 2